ncbi:MAG: glycosyltransferase family 39 protein, partial [Thermomicrobiales bacterium]
MPVQLAHFFVTDTWLTTFVTAALWATLVAAERGRTRDFALAGLLTGLAMATKGSVVLLGFAIVVAIVLAARRQQARRWEQAARSLFAAGVAGGVAFFLFEPYAVLNPKIYLRDLGEQSAIISGRFDVPYTRQFVGTLPLVYQAKQLVGWELGPLLGALVLAAFAWVIWRAIRRRRAADLVLLAWVLPYLLLLALNEAKFPRY